VPARPTNTPSAGDVLVAYWKCWRQRDKAATLALITDDVEYEMFIPVDVLPFGGRSVGKAATADRLQMMIDIFDVLHYDGVLFGESEATARGRVSIHVRHRMTGQEISVSMRQVVEVRDGLLSSIKVFTDVESIRATMAMIANLASDHPRESELG
jgi:ketosteroid isomerase-like protein